MKLSAISFLAAAAVMLGGCDPKTPHADPNRPPGTSNPDGSGPGSSSPPGASVQPADNGRTGVSAGGGPGAPSTPAGASAR